MKNNIINHILYEKLLKEFHPTKNGNLKLSDFSHGSHKKVWWKCYNTEFDDHEWEAVISHRTSGNKCPCCVGQKVVISNCLATLFPELINQWHPVKNGQSTPFDFTSGSRKKVYWKCDVANDHEWETSIFHRTNENEVNSCPCCSGNKVVMSNCLSTTHPNLSKEWHPIKNGHLIPFDVICGSNKKVHWICRKGHEWKSTIAKRAIRGDGCKICNESRGEKEVAKFLKKFSIIFERQKKFNGCKNKRKLPFDFYLPEHNILIEYDGEQHLRLSEYFGGEKSFKQLQIRDAIKTKFAQDNNIPLLRIPYTKFDNIEEIINSFLLNYQHKKTKS